VSQISNGVRSRVHLDDRRQPVTRVDPVHVVHELGSPAPLPVQVEPVVHLDVRLPEGYSLADVVELDHVEEQVVEAEWSHALACYVSPRAADPVQRPWQASDYVSSWGVFVHASAVEARAQRLYGALGLAVPEALGFAFADLVQHQLMHAQLDLASLRLEVDEVPLRTSLLEEALCEAQTVRTARARVALATTDVRRDQLEAARLILEERATQGPEGYRDWASVVEDHDRRTAIEAVLERDGVPRQQAQMLAVAADQPGPVRVQVPDVPLHLVVTAGTGAERDAWTAGLSLAN
jgi:hypothetical protein